MKFCFRTRNWMRFLKRFFQSFDFYFKLLVAFIPAVVLGLLLSDFIDGLLENPVTVAISLLIGGLILLKVDEWFNNPNTAETSQEITYLQALKIGLFQCIAMIPGVSRSAATIIGGLFQGLNRKTAAEFSFFLAVPTMFAASAYSLFLKDWEETGIAKKGYELIVESQQNINAFIVGNVVAFIVAILAIKQQLGIDAALYHIGRTPLARDRVVLAQVPPEVIRELL